MKNLLLIYFIFLSSVFSQTQNVLTGADIIVSEKCDLIKGKKLGIVTNHSALLRNRMHLVDSLFHINETSITALFGPEHGIRGDAPDGNTIKHGKDVKTGVPVYSLYGEIRKPTKEMLYDVDVLLFDIQDVGARFYTYISTLFYTIQAAAENRIPVIVLDRPNPVTGIKIDGPVRKDELTSFVGIAPIPIMHGMTVGELARYFNESGLLGNNLKADLNVITLQNWSRDLYFDQCNLNWVKPSPNIPDLETAIVYPGTCLVEGTNLSEGRGTEKPFLTIGAPYIKSELLISEMGKMNIPGVSLFPVSFTPVEIPNMASNPKYKGQECHGIQIKITDRKSFEPVRFGIQLVSTINKLFPEQFKFSDSRFDKLSGDKRIREAILAKEDAGKIVQAWQTELENFKQQRNKYLLY